MVRRYMSTLLLFAYLASQVAMVPHAHGAERGHQPSSQAERPHVHASWFEGVGHSHGDGHTHHHKRDASRSQPTSSDANAGHEDHDDDAVYLQSDTTISLLSKSVTTPDILQVNVTALAAAVSVPIVVGECIADANLPGECSSDCPLYLALRALRI